LDVYASISSFADLSLSEMLAGLMVSPQHSIAQGTSLSQGIAQRQWRQKHLSIHLQSVTLFHAACKAIDPVQQQSDVPLQPVKTQSKRDSSKNLRTNLKCVAE